MTRAEAEAQAVAQIAATLRSGNPAVFEAARGADGRIDHDRLVAAAIRAAARLADIIMQSDRIQKQKMGE